VEEERLILIGQSERGRLIVVSYTPRGDDRVRLISARKATVSERQDYEEK
jgi:uncharacterized protein